VEPQGEIEDDIEFVEDPIEADGQATQSSRFTAAERREVVDVACGGGFTVCVTRAGHVFSWGVWAHGRLGKELILCTIVPRLQVTHHCAHVQQDWGQCR
jgi:alpha-tubulin suppressor-like RCC1 family protein